MIRAIIIVIIDENRISIILIQFHMFFGNRENKIILIIAKTIVQII